MTPAPLVLSTTLESSSLPLADATVASSFDGLLGVGIPAAAAFLRSIHSWCGVLVVTVSITFPAYGLDVSRFSISSTEAFGSTTDASQPDRTVSSCSSCPLSPRSSAHDPTYSSWRLCTTCVIHVEIAPRCVEVFAFVNAPTLRPIQERKVHLLVESSSLMTRYKILSMPAFISSRMYAARLSRPPAPVSISLIVFFLSSAYPRMIHPKSPPTSASRRSNSSSLSISGSSKSTAILAEVYIVWDNDFTGVCFGILEIPAA